MPSAIRPKRSRLLRTKSQVSDDRSMDEKSFALFEFDPRPTLVLELEDTRFSRINFTNSAFQAEGWTHNDSLWQQLKLVDERSSEAKQTPVGISVNGIDWISYVVGKRWRVVQRLQPAERTTAAENGHKAGGNGSADSSSSRAGATLNPSQGSPATASAAEVFGLGSQAIAATPDLLQHLHHIDQTDWTSTPLGPLSQWPVDLIQLCHIVMLDTFPHLLILGPQKTIIYNNAYAVICGARHPSILGQGFYDAWPEAKSLDADNYADIEATGIPAVSDGFTSFVTRNGFIEETHFRWRTTPLMPPLQGFLTTALEDTHEKVTERRRSMLASISDAVVGVQSLAEYWRRLIQGPLEKYDKEAPFSFLYVQNDGERRGTSTPQSLYRRIGGEGIDSQAFPMTLDIAKRDTPLARLLNEAFMKGRPSIFGEEATPLLEGTASVCQSRGYADVCKSAAVLPLSGLIPQHSIGFLIIGLNTRIPYDDSYEDWLFRLQSAIEVRAGTSLRFEGNDLLAKETEARHAYEVSRLAEALADRTLEGKYAQERLDRLLQMVAMIDVGIFEYDPNGKLLQANEAFHKLSGHPKDSTKDEMTWTDCIFDEDNEWLSGQFSRIASGESITFEMRWKRPITDQPRSIMDYASQWVLAACVPIKDEQGQVTSVSGCITDIAAQKRSQQDAIRRAEALESAEDGEKRFTRFAENANVPIWIIDSNSNLTYANGEWFKVNGCTICAPHEVDWRDLVDPENLELIQQNLVTLFRERKALSFQYKVKNPWINASGDVGSTWLLATAYPELDEDGSIVEVYGSLTDISALKFAEAAQRARTDEAIEAKRQHENFVDMISHEIRNPLGAVVHCADMVSSSLTELETILNSVLPRLQSEMQGRVSENILGALEAVNTIISCSTHQRRIVDDILTLSKLDSRLLKISPLDIEPDRILRDVHSMFSVDAEKVGVELETVQDESIKSVVGNRHVVLDPGRLMQVLINLVTNAIKFTREEPEKRVRIKMSASTADTLERDLAIERLTTLPVRETSGVVDLARTTGEYIYLRFSVQDSGCGMDEEQQARLFARFSQGSPRTHTKYGGSGLGLFISRELTELQGGAIGVTSAPGVGSTFAFYIMARLAEAPSSSAAATNLIVTLFVPSNVKYSILVVEDNIVNQRVLSKQLQKMGHVVYVASHGVEALAFLKTSEYWRDSESKTHLSVVLMDVEMPIMDGISCARTIRELQESGEVVGHVPIIAVSANARVEQVEQAIACGMDDAICKPFRVVDLIPKIQRLVSS